MGWGRCVLGAGGSPGVVWGVNTGIGGMSGTPQNVTWRVVAGGVSVPPGGVACQYRASMHCQSAPNSGSGN